MNDNSYKLKYFKYKNKYLKLKNNLGGAMAKPFMFNISEKNVNGKRVQFIIKNKTAGISGGCGTEAVLNIFDIDWSKRNSKQALYDFSQQTKECKDAKESMSLWTDDITESIEYLSTILVVNTVDIGRFSNNEVKFLSTNEEITSSIIEQHPIICQELGGAHYVAYRPANNGKYYKIDPYSDIIDEVSSEILLQNIDLDIKNGSTTSVFAIIPKVL